MNILKLLKNLFVIELKRRLRLRDLGIFIIILIIFLYFVNIGDTRYKDVLENKDIFQQMEKLKVKQYHDYTLYGYYGVSIFFLPSPFSIFNVYTGSDELLANVNSGERLDISQDRKGRSYFNKSPGFMNLPGILLLFSVFFSLLYGCDTTRNKEYLRFLANLGNRWVIFFAIAFVRIVLLTLAFLVIIGISLLVASPPAAVLFQSPLLYIVLVVILVMAGFFFLGSIIGSITNNALIGIVFGSIYFISIFIIPGLLNQNSQADTKDIDSLYKLQIKNLELLMPFEKKAKESIGTFKETGEIASKDVIKVVKEGLDKKFPIIFARESEMMEKMLEKIRYRHWLSNFFPVLFYNSTVEELSSCGGLSFIDFYGYSKEMKKEFLDYYVKMKFLSKEKPGSVKSFVRGEENIFYARSRLPYRFWWGVGINMFYILVLGVASGLRFRYVIGLVERKGETVNVAVDFNSGQDNYVSTKDRTGVDHLYYVFSLGGKRFAGRVTLDGKLLEKGKKAEVIYLCRLSDLPGEMSVTDLLNLFKGFMGVSRQEFMKLKAGFGLDFCRRRMSALSMDEILQVSMKILSYRPGRVIMFDDIIDACSFEYISGEFAEEVKKIKAAHGLILYFGHQESRDLKIDRRFLYYRKAGGYTCEDLAGKVRAE